MILQLRLEPAAGPGLRMNQLSLGLGFYFIISLQLPRRQRKKEREGETPSWQISFPARGAGRGGMVWGRLTAVSCKGRSSYKGTSFSIGSCAGGAVQALKGSTGRNQAGKNSVPRKKRKAQQTRLFLHPRTLCHWLPHVSFLSPPASEQGSESSLEDVGSVRRQGPFHLKRSRGGRGKGRGGKMGKAGARFPRGLPQQSPSHPL